MRQAIFRAMAVAMLCAGGLPSAAADAQAADACAPTPENARDRLAQTGGDPVWALREWRAICPGEALAKQYAEALGQANSGQAPEALPGSSSPAQSSPEESPLASLSRDPPPEVESAPVGTFTYSGRTNYENRSGFEEWDDTVTFREDGTAEVQEKLKKVLYSGWYVRGCEEGTRSATALLRQEYAVTVTGDSVTFTRQGPTEVKRIDPGCWELGTEDYFSETWTLQWRDGRLVNDRGEEYRRQAY